jgi:uncharacterized coiled-coil protein SlyX
MDEDIRQRLERLEAANGEFRKIAANLEDALVITSAIQQRQSEVQKSQAQTLDRLDQSMTRLTVTVDELSDKLNGLIGYFDNLPRNPPQN